MYGTARWEEPWRAVGVAVAAAGDDAGGMETRDEDRGGDSCGRAAAGAAGLKNTVASFCLLLRSVFLCSSCFQLTVVMYCLLRILFFGRLGR